MDTPAFEVMQLCNLTKDKEMNMASLLLKLLELSITIYSEPKDPKTPVTSNTSNTN